MSRIKRWINMNKKEFNPDGSLKSEARQEMLFKGEDPGAIDSYARRAKEEYDEWKHLDETDPNGTKKSFKLCSVMITGIYAIKESRSKSDRYFL